MQFDLKVKEVGAAFVTSSPFYGDIITLAKCTSCRLSAFNQDFWIIKNFPDYQETFQIIRNLPRPSGHFPDYPKTFQTFRKPSRLSGNFPDHSDTFQTIWRLFRPSRNFSVYPEIFHAIRTLSRLFRSLPDYPEAS